MCIWIQIHKGGLRSSFLIEDYTRYDVEVLAGGRSEWGLQSAILIVAAVDSMSPGNLRSGCLLSFFISIKHPADLPDEFPALVEGILASWDWGDNTISEGTVTEPTDTESGSVTDSHSYSTPGVYTVILTVTDQDGNGLSDQSIYQYIVIYNPDDGFVTGGGKNEAGEQVASGIYFYTIQAGGFTATRKMILAK